MLTMTTTRMMTIPSTISTTSVAVTTIESQQQKLCKILHNVALHAGGVSYNQGGGTLFQQVVSARNVFKKLCKNCTQPLDILPQMDENISGKYLPKGTKL
jgi:hypothetical protein